MFAFGALLASIPYIVGYGGAPMVVVFATQWNASVQWKSGLQWKQQSDVQSKLPWNLQHCRWPRLAQGRLGSYKSPDPHLHMKRALRVKNRNLIHETPAVLRSAQMQDFVQAEIARKQWIYKIITGEKEQDQIIFRCDDFIVLPDTEALNDGTVLNWMVVFTDLDLLSMRSLRGRHVPMLEGVQQKIQELLPAEFDSPMIYFHYPPSVWQLHLHVAAPCDVLRTTNSMQKVCFLQDVLANLRIDDEYYAKATVTFILPSTHELSVINNEVRCV